MHTVIEDEYAAPYDWAAQGLRVDARWSGEPTRDEVRSALRDIGSDGVVVSGTAATLNLVVEGLRRTAQVTEVPVAFVPGRPPTTRGANLVQTATLDLADLVTVDRGAADDLARLLSAEASPLPLVRNDIGGVLLVEAVHAPERTSRLRAPSFGAQAYHDDALIADGPVRSISVRPDYTTENSLVASVTPTSGRKKIARTTGRAVQIACDPTPMWVDGRDLGEVEGRTWYVDDREHWLLRGANVRMVR